MRLDNLFWGMQFRTCKNFWEQQTASLVLSQKFLQIQKPHRHYFDCDSRCESATNQMRIFNISSLRDSAQTRGIVAIHKIKKWIASLHFVRLAMTNKFNTKEHKC